ncbi:MAG: apolipoprotein N-acyltransferase [Rhodospirillaceae bacterium]|nr:MAG: apolipoprotein N-acyltransferase [Rhodospirillaceae bacterium]
MSVAQKFMTLKSRLEALPKGRARGLAFVLGFLAAFAMPPLYQLYLLVPAFSGLLWLVMASSTRWQAFVVGWWFGAGFFAAGLYWVSFALLVDAAKFGWLIPLATLGFAFGFGLYSAFTTWVVRAVPGQNLVGKALILASSWTFFEWMRGWFLTGFPWNPLGSVWAFSEPLLQGASVGGVLGLSLLAALSATLPGALAQPGRLAKALNVAVLCMIVITWGLGQQRLVEASQETVPNVRLRLVQPNILQANKWKPALRESHMLTQLKLGAASPRKSERAPTHVIWAETSAPFFLSRHKPWLDMVGKMTPKGGLTILGAPNIASLGAPPQRPMQVTNSILAIDDAGKITAQYDKFHLVPFGEYMPLKKWLPLEKITQGAGSFLPGSGLRTLNLKGLPPVSPLICYEIIFSGEVVEKGGHPQWILNLTNDAWYGKTAGPYQHFVSTRLRAVEQGLPVVRVAGTGMSGIIDGYGRVTAQLALGEQNSVDGDLPKPVPAQTFFAKYGNSTALILIFLVGLMGVFMTRINGHCPPAKKA